MKVIDAYWEKRNLGVDVKEVECENQDTPDILKETLAKIDVPYSVVKIPASSDSLLYAVQECGFTFSEVGIELFAKVSDICLPPLYQRFLAKVRVEKASQELQNVILDQISMGKIFETDRIARDPFFSKEISGKRYANWIADEISRGCKLNVAFYGDEPVAFAINKPINDNYFNAFLGGVTEFGKNKGLGFLSIYANVESIKKYGGTEIVTKVSSNNLPILKLHQMLKFNIRDMKYVFIKHNS